jgi:hypothetical protein
VPFLYLNIWLEGKRLCRKLLGESLPRIRVPDVEVVHRILDERHMLLRPQEDLDRLPPHKALRRQGGYGWRSELVGGRLEGMLAAYGGIDPGDGIVRDVDEERCSTAYRQPRMEGAI